jgi:integrase
VSAAELLTEVGEDVLIRPMITVDDAIDFFDGQLARRGRSEKTRTNYRRILWKFADRFPNHWDISKVEEDDCNTFLDQWANRSLGTQGQVYAAVNGMFDCLYRTRKIKHNPMEFIDPPQRQRPEDLPVTTVSPLDVPLMLEAARPGSELNAIAILAYLGPRRHATALLTKRDYDQRTGEIRFREKGRKEIWKPVPDQLRTILDASIARGDLERPKFGSFGPTAYLIPPEGPLTRAGGRDDRIVWNIVKEVAGRVGIEAHVHALRGAFACFYLEQNPGDSYGLQQLLGHESGETTRVYLRRFDRRRAMAPVRSLAWLEPDRNTGESAGESVSPAEEAPGACSAGRSGEHREASTLVGGAGNLPPLESPQIAANRLSSSPDVGAGGFEPPSAESAGEEQAAPPTSLDDALTKRLERERERS